VQWELKEGVESAFNTTKPLQHVVESDMERRGVENVQHS
jgi:hypothetical protein